MGDTRRTTDQDVARVLEMLALGHSQEDARRATGISRTVVSRIANGWRPGAKAKAPSDLRRGPAKPPPRPLDEPLHCSACYHQVRGKAYWGNLCTQCGVGRYRRKGGPAKP